MNVNEALVEARALIYENPREQVHYDIMWSRVWRLKKRAVEAGPMGEPVLDMLIPRFSANDRWKHDSLGHLLSEKCLERLEAASGVNQRTEAFNKLERALENHLGVMKSRPGMGLIGVRVGYPMLEVHVWHKGKWELRERVNNSREGAYNWNRLDYEGVEVVMNNERFVRERLRPVLEDICWMPESLEDVKSKVEDGTWPPDMACYTHFAKPTKAIAELGGSTWRVDNNYPVMVGQVVAWDATRALVRLVKASDLDRFRRHWKCDVWWSIEPQMEWSEQVKRVGSLGAALTW